LAPRLAIADHGPPQPVLVVMDVAERRALRAHIALAPHVLAITADQLDPLVLHMNVEPTHRLAQRAGDRVNGPRVIGHGRFPRTAGRPRIEQVLKNLLSAASACAAVRLTNEVTDRTFISSRREDPAGVWIQGGNHPMKLLQRARVAVAVLASVAALCAFGA